MAKIDFAAARQHHLSAIRYERLRAIWYSSRGQMDESLRCTALVKHHRKAAENALMGIDSKSEADV
jgi:hypothetical protein